HSAAEAQPGGPRVRDPARARRAAGSAGPAVAVAVKGLQRPRSWQRQEGQEQGWSAAAEGRARRVEWSASRRQRLLRDAAGRGTRLRKHSARRPARARRARWKTALA